MEYIGCAQDSYFYSLLDLHHINIDISAFTDLTFYRQLKLKRSV